jgi:hypothetical protein
MNIKKSLVRKNKSAKISLVLLSAMVFFGAANIAHGDDSGFCTPDYSCAASTCLLDTCVDPNCGQIIYGQNTDQSCIDNMPCTQTLAGPIGNCTGNPTTPTNPSSPTPTDPTQPGGSGGKASADALTKPGDLLVYMATYGTVEGEAKYLAECQAAYSQIQTDLTAHASDTNWYSEYIAEIKVRNMLGLLEETVEGMGDGLSGQGAIDFVNKYVNPIVVSKNYLAYSSVEVTAVMAMQTGNGTGLNDDKDKLTASKISGMFSNSARYDTGTSPNVSGTYGSQAEADAVLIANGYHSPMCIPQALPTESQLSCYYIGGMGATLVNYSSKPNEWIVYCNGTGTPVGGTPTTPTTPGGSPSLSASVTSGTAPLNVSFTLTNGTECINYKCGADLNPTAFVYEHSFSCQYATAGTYTASISCGGAMVEKVITVTDPSRTAPTPVTPSFSASTTSGAVPLDVNFTLTNGTGCINYLCGVGFGASVYDYEHSFSCHYPIAGTYVASIECGGSKIEKTISVTGSDVQNPTRGTGTIPGKPTVDKPSGTNFTTSPGKITVTSNNATKLYYSSTFSTDGNPPSDPLPFILSGNGKMISGSGGIIELPSMGGLKTNYKLKIYAANNDSLSEALDVSYGVEGGSGVPSAPTCSASFSATATSAGVSNLSITAPATAYLDFSSTGANRMMASCTSPLLISPAIEVPLSYANYPFPFTATQTGTEKCTFTPYNGTTPGEPCEAIVTVNASGTPPAGDGCGSAANSNYACNATKTSGTLCAAGVTCYANSGYPPNPCPTDITLSGNSTHWYCGSANCYAKKQTDCSTPTPPGNTGCASQTCVGVTCYDGSTPVHGTKTSGCATVTASFNPSRINSATGSQPTSAEIAYLTWSSSGASKVEIACDGPTLIPRSNWFLNTAAWYSSQTAYQKTATTPDGYPGWFPRGTSGIETCTFYPTNSIGGQAGTPFSASINVVNPSSSGTDCECSNNLVFSGGSACTGGTCDGCHCVYSGTPPATPPPAPSGDTSAYKSITQFQQSLCERDSAGYCSSYTPIVTGFKNAFPPSANSTQGEQRLYRTVFGYTAESNSVRISYSEGDMEKFKVYIPASATDINLTLYNSQRNGSGAYLYAVARSGETPQGDYSDISQLDNVSSAAGTLSDITNRDNVTSFSGGMTRILDGPVNNFQGGWVYVKIIRSNISIGSVSFSTTVNSQNYPTWYNGLTTNNGWLADGDPAETINPGITSPSRGSGAAAGGNDCVPNCACAADTSVGSTCSNGCGGTCSGTKSTCYRDDPACAAHTCKDVYCFDGCERQRGTLNCSGKE